MAERTIAPVATHGFFVDGRWQQEGDIVEIRSPYDGTLVARVAQGRKEHAEAAIAAAVKAFGTTRRLPAFERQRILRQIVAFMIERKEEFARTLAQEAGKPIKAARTEVERSIFTFTVAAEESTRIYGEYLPLDWQEFTAGRWGIVRRFPLGPVAGITPFNFPWNRVPYKVASSIAGVIVHSDADLAYAAERGVAGGFAYAGQTCISVQRILVEHSVYGKFTELLLAGVQKLKTGDPLDDTTDLGSLIRESDAARASDWIQEAVRGGARLLCGGRRHGAVLEPAVLTGTKPDMKVNCQEIFAPVVTVEPYNDFNAAVRQINNSPYGLQAGIFTRDAKLLFHAYEELEVGGVIAGDVPAFRVDHMPYGGIKDSGLGREGLRYAIEEMTEPKLLVMNLR